MADRAVGIDLGSRVLDAVVLEASGDRFVVADATILLSTETNRLADLCAGAAAVAIDAPAELSQAVHAKDQDLPKSFRTARCCENALREQFGLVVQFRTPAEDPSTWMQTGFSVWASLRAAGHSPLEVYPHGAFSRLANGPLRSKTTSEGRDDRRTILSSYIDLPASASTWNDDTIDAAAAALIAIWHARSGPVIPARHDDQGCDGSAIWIPVGA